MQRSLRRFCLSSAVLLGFVALVTSYSCGGSPTDPSTRTVPTPLAPLTGTSLANACSGDSWVFDWSDVQASAYRLQVFSPSGATALDRSDIRASLYTWSQPPTVEENARRGWRWRVQAWVGGSGGDWTPEVLFDVDPLSPRLISPAADATMDNGCRSGADTLDWAFQWSACRGADSYHLFVTGPTASMPLFNDDRLTTTSYQRRMGGFIAPGNDRGWTWRLRTRIGGIWRDWSETRTFNVEPVDTDCAQIPAPQQLSPPDGAVFDHFPRTTTLVWAPVPQAASYTLDRESCQNPRCVEGQTVAYGLVTGLASTTHTFDFVGAQPGRWRVWAVDGSGVSGAMSGWWEFRYTR